MATDYRLTADVLDEADGDELVWRVIEPVYEAVSAHDGAEALDAALAPLTPGQRALFALHWTVAEVCNGGFDQYFFNSTGDLAPEALAGFRRIGANRSAALLEEVFRAFPGGGGAGPPRDGEARVDALESLDDEAREVLFEAYDERFYELMDAELYPRAAAYVRAHPEEFVRQHPRLTTGG